MKREHLQIVGTICATVLMLAWFTHSPARPAKASEPDSVNSFRQTALLLRHAESRQELIEQLRRERTVYIPILIEQMGADESRIRQWLRQAAKSVPIIQNNLALPAEVFRAGASWGLLEILREGGAATPEELELLYPALRKALADESVRVRMNAAASLGALGSMNPETEKMCVAALRDSNRWVRHNGSLRFGGYAVRTKGRRRSF